MFWVITYFPPQHARPLVYCSKYEEVDECLAGVKCKDEFKMALEGLDKSMDFMCRKQPEGPYPWKQIQ